MNRPDGGARHIFWQSNLYFEKCKHSDEAKSLSTIDLANRLIPPTHRLHPLFFVKNWVAFPVFLPVCLLFMGGAIQRLTGQKQEHIYYK